ARRHRRGWDRDDPRAPHAGRALPRGRALSSRPADPLRALAGSQPHVYCTIPIRFADLDLRRATLSERRVAPLGVGDLGGPDDDQRDADRAIRVIGGGTARYAELARGEVLDDEWKWRLQN